MEPYLPIMFSDKAVHNFEFVSAHLYGGLHLMSNLVGLLQPAGYEVAVMKK
jgi:hypothetical protein